MANSNVNDVASARVDNLLSLLAESIEIVLVNTSHPGNIGAVARAMKNMGLRRLCLVEPNQFPSEEAVARASGADDILSNATVVSSLDEALADSQVVVGASARTRKMVWPLVNPRECAGLLTDKLRSSSTKISILFGREASGLTNEELQRCHYHVNIPANPDYASLNLAMAVQVISYELRMSVLMSKDEDVTAAHPEIAPVLSPKDEMWDGELANVAEVEGFLGHLESTLIKIGYHDPSNPRMLMPRLRRLFQRAHLDKMEVNILRGILKDVLKHVDER